MGGIVLDRKPVPARSVPSRAELIAASQALIAGLDLLARQRFVAVEFVGDDGKRIEIFGRLARRPKLSARDSSDLRLGLPLIVTEHPAGESSRIYLLRRVVRRNEVRGTFVGEVSPEYLWGSLDQSMPSPTTRVAVLDEARPRDLQFGQGAAGGGRGSPTRFRGPPGLLRPIVSVGHLRDPHGRSLCGAALESGAHGIQG